MERIFFLQLQWNNNFFIVFYKYRDNASKLQQLLSQRMNLDRRRLEEGFLQYACLETIQNNLWQDLPALPSDRNELLEIVTKKLSKAF